MGAAAYNRGTKVIARDADVGGIGAIRRAERDAIKDERRRLLDQIESLQRDLARARRCIYELRRSKEERMAEARKEQSRSDAVIRTLTRIAFGTEEASGGQGKD